MPLFFEQWEKVNLKVGSRKVPVESGFFTADVMANRLGVIVTDGDAPVSLSGSVKGYAKLPDGTLLKWDGVIDSTDRSKAYVDCPAEMYHPGPVTVSIRNISDSTETVLIAYTGYIDAATDGDIVVPSGVPVTPHTYSTKYTPQGTVQITADRQILSDVSVSSKTFTGTEGNVSVSGTPEGTVGKITPEGTISEITPAGTVSAPTITVTPTKTTKYVAGSANGGGSVTAGTAAVCTMPAMTMNYDAETETLELDWADGSFTANKPTQVTLPSFTSQEIMTGASASASDPVFTGTKVQPTFTGTEMQPTFTGEQMTATGKFTPQGSIDVVLGKTSSDVPVSATFTGTEETITVGDNV